MTDFPFGFCEDHSRMLARRRGLYARVQKILCLNLNAGIKPAPTSPFAQFKMSPGSRTGFDNAAAWIIIAASFPNNKPCSGRFQMRNRIMGVIGVVVIVIVVAGLLRMTGMSVDNQTAGPS